MNETKEVLIWATIIIVVISIIISGVLLNQNHKREKINQCIQKTGNEMKCKCVYRDCFKSETLGIFVNETIKELK